VSKKNNYSRFIDKISASQGIGNKSNYNSGVSYLREIPQGPMV
jgi:hypothetical protein